MQPLIRTGQTMHGAAQFAQMCCDIIGMMYEVDSFLKECYNNCCVQIPVKQLKGG